MAFHFPLQGLLRLRKSLENREQLRLDTILREIVKLQRLIDSLIDEDRAAKRNLAHSMIKGVMGADLHLESAYGAARNKLQETLLQKMTELHQLRSRQQIILQRAKQSREIIEHLRDRQFEQYRQVQARREQQQLDELFLSRRTLQASRPIK